MRGVDLIIQLLKQEGVDTLFGFPGGAIMPMYDAIYDSGLTHILPRHEQGAALAAVGYARASGKTGVCLSTSGPGACGPGGSSRRARRRFGPGARDR